MTGFLCADIVDYIIVWLFEHTPLEQILDSAADYLAKVLPTVAPIVYCVFAVFVLVLFAVYVKRHFSGSKNPRFCKASKVIFTAFGMVTALASNIISYNEVESYDGEGLMLLLTAPLFLGETVAVIAFDLFAFFESKQTQQPKDIQKCYAAIAGAVLLTIVFNAYMILTSGGTMTQLVAIIIANLIAGAIQLITIYLEKPDFYDGY